MVEEEEMTLVVEIWEVGISKHKSVRPSGSRSSYQPLLRKGTVGIKDR